MHIVAGTNPESSQRVSDKYLQINGVGSTLEEQRDLINYRPNGRCDYSLLYIDRGSIQFDLGNGYEEIEAGHFLIYRPGEPQNSILRRDHVENHYWIHFSGTAVDSILKELCLYDKKKIYTGISQSIIDIYEAIYREMLYRHPGYEQIINSDIIQLLTYAARNSSCVAEFTKSEDCIIIGTMWDKRLFPALLSIHVHFEKFFNVNELAEMCHLSKYYFCRLFLESVGMTPHKYMTKIKIEKACEMLRYSDLPVTEISDALGFTDVTIFRRAFMRIAGKKPSEFRNS